MLVRQHLPLAILGAVFASVLTYMVLERRRHQRNLDTIGTKILVNGSRGKSSTTRLIRAALAADPGRTVIGKTTGSAARFIYPGGRETPIIRKNNIVNVIEQVAVIARAVALKADTAVIECMAVDPDLQQLNQEVLIQSDIGIITNVRPDHLDEMGGPDRTVEQVARSLCRGIPRGGICITAETDLLGILREEAQRRDAILIPVSAADVSDAEMIHFPWICFPDNVAIALKVAELRGIPRHRALQAMYAAAPDPGVLRVDDRRHAGIRFASVNLAAANDPQSTVQNMRLLRRRGLVRGEISLVINCRPDRAERNGQMGAIAGELGAGTIFLIGSPTKSAADHIPAELQDRVVHLEGEHYSGSDVLEAIVARMQPRADQAVVLVGNIHGAGELLLHALHDAAYDGPDLDEELAALTAGTGPLPTVGLDKTLVWRDDATVIIPEFPGNNEQTRVLSRADLDRARLAGEPTRRLFLPEPRNAPRSRR